MGTDVIGRIQRDKNGEKLHDGAGAIAVPKGLK
jgi:hypothetical protein